MSLGPEAVVSVCITHREVCRPGFSARPSGATVQALLCGLGNGEVWIVLLEIMSGDGPCRLPWQGLALTSSIACPAVCWDAVLAQQGRLRSGKCPATGTNVCTAAAALSHCALPCKGALCRHPASGEPTQHSIAGNLALS